MFGRRAPSGWNRLLRDEARAASLKAAEAAGQVADSIEVRKALIAKMDAGEMTLDQVQAELAKIKRGAKKAGKITRAQAFLAKG